MHTWHTDKVQQLCPPSRGLDMTILVLGSVQQLFKEAAPALPRCVRSATTFMAALLRHSAGSSALLCKGRAAVHRTTQSLPSQLCSRRHNMRLAYMSGRKARPYLAVGDAAARCGYMSINGVRRR